jgi:hypothetical protein
MNTLRVTGWIFWTIALTTLFLPRNTIMEWVGIIAITTAFFTFEREQTEHELYSQKGE